MNNYDFKYGLYQRTTISSIDSWVNDLTAQLLLDCSEEDLTTDPEAKRCYKYVQRKLKQVNRLRKKECEVLVK